MDAEHLSVEGLALLAEQGSQAARDEPAIRHLARCRSCMAAYSDAVRYRAAWLASREMFESPDEMTRFLPGRRLRDSMRPLIAASLLVVLGAGAYLLAPRTRSTPTEPGFVTTLLQRASASDLVFPGGEAGAARATESYRSGAVDREPELAAELDSLVARYERGPHAIADLYALSAALTASGRTDLAQDYIQEGRALQPENPRFLVLGAILARRQGRIEEAGRLLGQARHSAPQDPTVMLDQAIVLSESGSPAEARPLLNAVIRRAPGSPLSRRAAQVLRGLRAS